MDYSNSAYRGGMPEFESLDYSDQDQEARGSPTRLYASSSSSPQDPNFPGHAHPCPHMNQQRADGRPSNHPSLPNSATEVSAAAAHRTPAFSPLPNPLSPQRRQGAHARATEAIRNSNSPLARGWLNQMGEIAPGDEFRSIHLSLAQGVALDGIATPGSLYESSILRGTPYAGPTPFNPRPNMRNMPPRIRGHSHERRSRSPNAGATSPTPRRREHGHRSSNLNGFHSDLNVPGIAHLTAASVERRRPRPHTRLRRSRGHPGDDGMDSDAAAPEFPPDEFSPYAGEGLIDEARQILEEEGAVVPRTPHTVRRQQMTSKATYKLQIESLESVPLADIPATERMCPICYNEYGVEGPEGINEAPLRIPRCKHIFGDHCIKKWLSQKHSCPYCRESAFVLTGSELPSPSMAAHREAVDARARQQWLQGVSALHRAVGDSRRAHARPHPPPSDHEEPQRRTRQRLSREDSSLQTGSNSSGETAFGDGSQTESQSTHGAHHQHVHRAPPIETLPPPSRLLPLAAREHGMSQARHMHPQPLAPSFVGGHPQTGHVPPPGFQPFDTFGILNPDPHGAMAFHYVPGGPVYAQPLPNFEPPAHFSSTPSYPGNSMLLDSASGARHAGLSPMGMAPFSPPPDRSHHAEAPAPYRPNVPAHPDPGNNGHPEHPSPGSASTRGRVW